MSELSSFHSINFIFPVLSHKPRSVVGLSQDMVMNNKQPTVSGGFDHGQYKALPFFLYLCIGHARMSSGLNSSEA